MMTETQPDKDDATARKLRKLIVSMLLGAVIGVAGSAGIITLLERSSAEGLSVSNTIAATIGAMYVIIAIGVGLGALRPALGERYLNVEDAEELQDARPMLTYSSIAMTLYGAALIALAFAAPDGPLGAALALALAGFSLAAGSWAGWLSYRHSDELMTATNLEGGAIAFMLVFIALAGWGTFAHLGFVSAPSPLDLVSGFYALSLLATFIAVGRRGMLAPK